MDVVFGVGAVALILAMCLLFIPPGDPPGYGYPGQPASYKRDSDKRWNVVLVYAAIVAVAVSLIAAAFYFLCR